MINIKDPNGILLLDMSFTFDMMEADLAKPIIREAVTAKFQPVIATGNNDITSLQTCVDLLELPENMVPHFRTHAQKGYPDFYHMTAAQYGVPLNRILLVDDDPKNVICAVETGAKALLFYALTGSPVCERYNDKSSSFGEKKPALVAIEEALLQMQPKPPKPKTSAAKTKTSTRPVARRQTRRRSPAPP